MAHQPPPSPPPASFTSRRAATMRITSRGRIARAARFAGSSLAGGSLVACASLLGIEDATCDPAFDARCPGRSVGMLMPAPGSGGTALTAGTGGAPGTANGAGAGGGGAGGVAEPVELPLCERYCNTIAAACTGANEQYASSMACRAVCAHLDPGVPGDDGNTVECRLELARLAQDTGERSLYCHAAGPGGGGVCGTDCEGFCAIMSKTCTLMGSYEQCLPLCDAVPDLSESEDGGVTYATSIQDGDSLQCRLYHVTAAALDARMHCAHAAGVAICAND